MSNHRTAPSTQQFCAICNDNTEHRHYQEVKPNGGLVARYRCVPCMKKRWKAEYRQEHTSGVTGRPQMTRTPDPLLQARPGETVCPDCFLIHPAGCCDR